jgi:hypothetical protein
MLKKLTYFNLIFGACLFVLSFSRQNKDFITLVMVIIPIAYNWVMLKKIEGIAIVSIRTQKILQILSMIVGILFLIDGLTSFIYFSKTDTRLSILVPLVLIRFIFGFIVIAHAIKVIRLERRV